MATTECKRCCGTGKVGNFANVKGGVCFACNGTGRRVKMRRHIETATVFAAVCELNNSKVQCADGAKAAELVAAWGAMNVPGRVEVRHVRRVTMVAA